MSRAMTREQLEIRPARPEDAPQLAPLVHSSGPRAFNWIFAPGDMPDSLPFLERCLGRRRGLLGWANHHVATLEGEVVASVALWSKSAVFPHTFFAALRIFGFYKLRAPGVSWRGLVVEGTLLSPTADALYLGHLAVDPALRGKGIGRKLLAFAHEQALAGGYRRLLLDVADDNPDAKRLYERLGYVGLRHVEFSGPKDAVPNITQMELQLPAALGPSS